MKISKKSSSRRRIVAADEPFVDDMGYDLEESVDDVAEDIADIKDAFEEVSEDNIDIDIDNNITGHYIAECDSCHGVFISALVETDQEVDSITGTCPICDKETEQFIKWVIKDV